MRARFRLWKNDVFEHKGKIALACVFFGIALVATVVSSTYADGTRSVAVPDLVLDYLPTLDLSFIFVWGAAIVFSLFLLYPLLFEPKKFHYALGMLSLFMLVRSAFLILTHLKAPANAVTVTAPSFLQILTYSNDLFFSGHTGLPFLGFLIFKNPWIKWFMLLASAILAVTVLIMHVHYSIDVASAYFITYGVFILGKPLFGDAGAS